MAAQLPKIFVDTNEWAPTLWTSSSATEAVALLASGQAPLLVSSTVIEELARSSLAKKAGEPVLGSWRR